MVRFYSDFSPSFGVTLNNVAKLERETVYYTFSWSPAANDFVDGPVLRGYLERLRQHVRWSRYRLYLCSVFCGVVLLLFFVAHW